MEPEKVDCVSGFTGDRLLALGDVQSDGYKMAGTTGRKQRVRNRRVTG